MATMSHGAITMTGSAIRVTKANTPIRAVRFQYEPSYTANIFIGGIGVTKVACGYALTAANQDSGWIRFEGASPGDLADFYVIGDASDIVNYMAIEAL